MNLRRAFSLVELSIVLVILGLLVGGVLSGQSLIRASELRSVTREYTQYHTAVQSFRDKYFMLPGDITNATQFWGLLDADPNTCRDTASTDTRTCNGDGDGKIELTIAGSYEHGRAWQHLSNAGLMEGSYAGNAPDGCSVGLCPVPRIGKGTHIWWLIEFDPSWWGPATLFAVNYGNSFRLGTSSAHGGPLRPEEAWNIDTKMDDGKPATGKVIVGSRINVCTDTAVVTNFAANYLLTSSVVNCGLLFRQQF